ncbi:hypothetical protein HY030_00240 [Candidatus Gottesmanbacteria bacterium]|nr:hypothetical protein [Candidatus Gottesmanbacteria bacterium]
MTIIQAAVKTATDINNGTSSFVQSVASYLLAGLFFIFIFYLLLKKFLKT